MTKLLLLQAIILLAMAAPAKRIEVQGHRGARAMRTENTLAAFEYAIAQGVDVLELDLAVTKDDVLVVSHDPVLSEVFCGGGEGTRVIREMTFEQLRRWDCGIRANPQFPKQVAVPSTRVASLDEVFGLSGKGSFRFNVETKIFPAKPELTPPPDEFAAMVLRSIRRHKLERRVILQSFDFHTLHAMKRIAPEIALSALFPSSIREAAKDYVEIAKEAGAGIVSPEYHTVTKTKITAAHQAGLTVIPWTANTPSDWNALIEAGADAIITDDPAALITYLKNKGLR